MGIAHNFAQLEDIGFPPLGSCSSDKVPFAIKLAVSSSIERFQLPAASQGKA
jgi:hypothetical protein